MAQKLKFGNGVWANKKGSTLAYNDENDNYKPLPFTFTRASTATRVNKAGLIEVVGNDKPRIDYTDSSDGVLLLEPARTNLETKSNKFSTWGTISNITRTADYIISPDGTLNGTRLQFTANGFVANTPQSLATYTMSCYAKRNDSGTQNVGFFTNGSGVVNSAWAVTSEWKRFSYTFPALNGSFMGIAGLSGADISVYGFQIEGLVSYPTSYIPTSGSQKTRIAEVCKDSGNSEVFNDSEGVLMFQTNPSENGYISLTDGSSNNRIFLGFDNLSAYTQIRVGGAVKADMITTAYPKNTTFKILVKYKTNDFALWVNGFEVKSDNNGSTFPSGVLNNLSFNVGAGSAPFYGKTKELGYYDTALTDAELEYMTSYRSWESMVNELNLNIIYNG